MIGLPPVNVLEQQVSEFYSPNIYTDEYEPYIQVELFQKGMRLGYQYHLNMNYFLIIHDGMNIHKKKKKIHALPIIQKNHIFYAHLL